MKSKEYWDKRMSAVAKKQHKKADRYINKELRIEYLRARSSILRDIEVFYQRFAENNDISYAEAKKLLNDKQLEEFKMQVDEFISFAKDNPNGKWTKVLDNASYKVRISRLQALQIQIEHQIQMLGVKEEKQYTGLLSNTYTDTYYRTLYEVQKGTGIGVSFAPLEAKTVERIIKTPWLEENYSSRIWGNKKKLIRELKTELNQAIIRGDSLDKMSRALRKRMDVSYKAASRLVQTEASYIQNESTYHSYKDSGVVTRYQYLATLDSRTSQICRDMDNKVFKLSEKQVGVNFPPLHPHCRSTVVPYFDDEIDIGERIAREGKKVYYVPGDISYKEWYGNYAA